ncbi:hypothetical protein [Bdellovibrio bacteriovorus]|uniref:hypothetical protein n=1 Tax=Bdellovibrio bacteriovorus TaxID=959 RepID=UPI0035A6CA09
MARLYQDSGRLMPVILYRPSSSPAKDDGEIKLEKRHAFLTETSKELIGEKFEGLNFIESDELDSDLIMLDNLRLFAKELSKKLRVKRIAIVLIRISSQQKIDLLIGHDGSQIGILASKLISEIMTDTGELTCECMVTSDAQVNELNSHSILALELVVSHRVLSYEPSAKFPKDSRSRQVFRALTPILSGIVKNS